MNTQRRQFLEALVGAAGVLASCDACTCTGSSPPQANAPRLAGGSRPSPDLDLVLSAAPGTVPLLDGPPTAVWRFSARVLSGPASAVVAQDAGYLGPTLRLRQGQRVRVQFDNALGQDSIVHWHGLHLSEQNDGHPNYSVPSGARYVYDFEVANRAGTYWYHPHPADQTGLQVYRGLAGLLLVTDDDEQRIGLPDGDRELTLVLQDRTFDQYNQLVYAPNRMIGMLGDRVLVNGQTAKTREVQRGPHRLRILNGSNSRFYDLAWSDGSPMTVLGTDGGLLESAVEKQHLVLAPGQRLDVWASFGSGPGDDVWLESRAFDDPGPAMGMGRGMEGGGVAKVPNGTPLRIQRFVATGKALMSRAPDRLSRETAPNAEAPRATKTFTTQMRMMRWLLNGRAFEPRGVADNERVRLGSTEDWEFVNAGGPMTMAHPIHLHGPQFRILERVAGPGLATLRDGLFDQGWQDTFLLLPGDRVRLRVRFERHAGMFLYHCHNLEHEDMGMMRNYLVEPS